MCNGTFTKLYTTISTIFVRKWIYNQYKILLHHEGNQRIGRYTVLNHQSVQRQFIKEVTTINA